MGDLDSKGVGRPPLDPECHGRVTLQVVVTEDMADIVDDLRGRRTRSSFIRELIADRIAAQGGDNK